MPGETETEEFLQQPQGTDSSCICFPDGVY